MVNDKEYYEKKADQYHVVGKDERKEYISLREEADRLYERSREVDRRIRKIENEAMRCDLIGKTVLHNYDGGYCICKIRKTVILMDFNTVHVSGPCIDVALSTTGKLDYASFEKDGGFDLQIDEQYAVLDEKEFDEVFSKLQDNVWKKIKERFLEDEEQEEEEE